MTDRELMQMALDALDSDNPDIQLRAATHLRAALAQPEQEKLGEIVPADEEQLERIAKLVKPEPQGGYRWREGDVPPSMTYTAPPQREWQGLTPEDKRIAGIPLYTDQISMSDAFDVIEKILKEKNT